MCARYFFFKLRFIIICLRVPLCHNLSSRPALEQFVSAPCFVGSTCTLRLCATALLLSAVVEVGGCMLEIDDGCKVSIGALIDDIGNPPIRSGGAELTHEAPARAAKERTRLGGSCKILVGQSPVGRLGQRPRQHGSVRLCGHTLEERPSSYQRISGPSGGGPRLPQG